MIPLWKPRYKRLRVAAHLRLCKKRHMAIELKMLTELVRKHKDIEVFNLVRAHQSAFHRLLATWARHFSK